MLSMMASRRCPVGVSSDGSVIETTLTPCFLSRDLKTIASSLFLAKREYFHTSTA